VTAKEEKNKLFTSGAVKIKAALSQSINAKTIVDGYMETHPLVTDSPAKDATRARAWATLAVKVNTEPLRQVMRTHQAMSYALGLHEGKELMVQALRSNKGAVSARINSAFNHSHAQLLAPVIPINTQYMMDWEAWRPGNEAAALLLDPPGGLAKLLDGLDIKGLVNTTLDQLGTKLAEGLRAGSNSVTIARSIQDDIVSSSRALTISLTEGTRAMVEANRQSFTEQNVEQWEWTVTDPQDEDCLMNDGEVVNIGDDFPSGEPQPPQHPSCMCSVKPLMPDMTGFENIDPNITGYENL
jgi:hypothetical protein